MVVITPRAKAVAAVARGERSVQRTVVVVKREGEVAVLVGAVAEQPVLGASILHYFQSNHNCIFEPFYGAFLFPLPNGVKPMLKWQFFQGSHFVAIVANCRKCRFHASQSPQGIHINSINAKQHGQSP